MGNTLTTEQETTPTVAGKSKSFPEKLKKLAQGNITALLAKKGWKLHPQFHLRLSLPSNQMTLQMLLKFLHRNRMRIASLKKLSVVLDAQEIIPLLLTTVSIRPLIKTLGRRLSRLQNLEAAEIGSSHMNAFSIEETLLESVSKIKKITSLSLEIPDNQNKINVIAKKLVNFKRITRLTLHFSVRNSNIKPILNRIKLCSRLEVLKIDLSDCSLAPDLMCKLAEILKKMKKLEFFNLNLQRTAVKDDEMKLLYNTVESLPRIENFRFHVEGCSELSWLWKAKLYAKKTLGSGDHC